MNIANIRAKLNSALISRNLKQQELSETHELLAQIDEQLRGLQQLRDYVKIATLQTQQNIEGKVSHIVTLSLASVWDDPYGFKMKFIVKNNRTECDLLLTRQGHEFKAIGTVGGGVCDVVAFALQLAYLTLKMSRLPTRRVLVLDERFRNLHGEQQQLRCSEMIKTICQAMKFQVILVSDVKNMNQSADNIIHCRLISGKTVVTQTIRRTLIKKRKLIPI